jgi:hypothetical protein
MTTDTLFDTVMLEFETLEWEWQQQFQGRGWLGQPDG